MIIYQQQFVFKYCITIAFTTTGILVLIWAVFALGKNLVTETLSLSTILCARTSFLGKVLPFRGDQYFSPTNNFTRLKLTPTKTFYQLFFLLNKNQITEILKSLLYLLYHLIEWRWLGKRS